MKKSFSASAISQKAPTDLKQYPSDFFHSMLFSICTILIRTQIVRLSCKWQFITKGHKKFISQSNACKLKLEMKKMENLHIFLCWLYVCACFYWYSATKSLERCFFAGSRISCSITVQFLPRCKYFS